MATVVKDFKIKSGLVVEGTTGTINNFDILTKKQADQDYIVGLIGGTSTPDNTPDTVVKRDEDGSFAAQTVTVETLNVSGVGTISDDDELLIAASAGEDIKLTADDVRIEAVDDFRATAGGDIVLEAGEGNHVYAGSISAENVVVTEGILDSHIGDNTVDGTAGNTITDRIASASQDLTDHENATEAHGATGAVVGTTNEQTLTNKTISYADNTLTVQVANVSDLTATASELNVLDGITASTAELNILDGVTATASELNLLDGVTATTAELNYVDGVTSSIQDQLDDKAPLESPALTGTPTAPTAAAGTNSTQVATTAYADAAVAALVDGAPDLLNTLNELAAALDDNPDVISDLQDIAAGKQDALTAGTNIGIVDDVISVVGLMASDISDFASASQSANIGYYDPAGSAQTAEDNAKQHADAVALTAENNAKGYADSLGVNYDPSGSAATAESNANTYTNTAIGALTTDDIPEELMAPVNRYFTDIRAKGAAADLLVNASKTNITITGNEDGLTITAENGVAESTTDDLVEGEENLYFTDERVIDAVDNAVINPQAVEVNMVARQVASTLEAATAGIQVGHSFAKADYRSAEFLVKVAYGTHTEISKVLLTLDTSDNISITEYGIVGTNGSASSISADVSGDNVRLLVTTSNNNSTVTVMGTLLV
jgi:hypothetical protein